MTAADADNKRIRVLLVEDDPDDLFLIQEVLVQAHAASRFELVHARSLEEALERVDRETFHLALLDLSLPDSKGLETFTRFQKKAPESLSVVVLTSSYQEDAALKAVSQGAQDYLVKGQLTGTFLLRTILHAIERHRIKKELRAVTRELRAANLRLESLTMIEPLTELLNRRGLQQVLLREIQWAKRDDSDLLVILLDLDDFKRINDSLGHVAGDVVLKEVAKKLKKSLRATDYVARIGGDEFLVLLPETRAAEGIQVAEKIRLAISVSPIHLNQAAVKVTASLGVVTISQAVPSVEELLSHCQHMLQRSKHGGKNRVSYDRIDADGTIEQASDASTPLVPVLEALRGGRCFRTMMQPIYDLEKGRRVGYEFLSRTTIPGFETPDVFFKLSMEENMLTLVDHQCFQACARSGSILAAAESQHLNLFPTTILSVPPESLIENLLPAQRGERTCIELSEQQIIGDPSYLISSIDALRHAGIRIAIDDVGFGRSCLESLILLEPDVVKIDKKWVQGIHEDKPLLEHLKRLLRVVQSLDAEVVAEGIERREDLDVLRELGVAFGQGYYLGAPHAVGALTQDGPEPRRR